MGTYLPFLTFAVRATFNDDARTYVQCRQQILNRRINNPTTALHSMLSPVHVVVVLVAAQAASASLRSDSSFVHTRSLCRIWERAEVQGRLMHYQGSQSLIAWHSLAITCIGE